MLSTRKHLSQTSNAPFGTPFVPPLPSSFAIATENATVVMSPSTEKKKKGHYFTSSGWPPTSALLGGFTPGNTSANEASACCVALVNYDTQMNTSGLKIFVEGGMKSLYWSCSAYWTNTLHCGKQSLYLWTAGLFSRSTGAPAGCVCTAALSFVHAKPLERSVWGLLTCSTVGKWYKKKKKKVWTGCENRDECDSWSSADLFHSFQNRPFVQLQHKQWRQQKDNHEGKLVMANEGAAKTSATCQEFKITDETAKRNHGNTDFYWSTFTISLLTLIWISSQLCTFFTNTYFTTL